jgi:hypothetical protein
MRDRNLMRAVIHTRRDSAAQAFATELPDHA